MAFIADLHAKGLSASMNQAISAIGSNLKDHGLPDPTTSHRIKVAVKGAIKTGAIRMEKRNPLPVSVLERFCRWGKGSRLKLEFWRDETIVAIGLRAMCRLSELFALNTEDVYPKDGWCYGRIQYCAQ